MAIPLRLVKFLIRSGIARRMPEVRRVVGQGLDYLGHYSDGVLMAPNVELLATQSLFTRARELEGSGDGRGVIDLSLGAPRFGEGGRDAHRGFVDRSPHPDPPPRGGRETNGFPPRNQPPREGRETDCEYPPPLGLPELRWAIAEKLRVENGIDCHPERETVVASGVCQGISLAVDTFVNPGDRVVLLDPSFFVYNFALQIARARIRWVSAPSVEGRTQIDLRRLDRSLRGAKMLILNSPSNPTGGVLAVETLERIVHLARRRRVLLFSDEVYERFHYNGRFVSTASLSGAREWTITANSFSKSYGLAGYRVGYLAATEGLMRPMQMNLLVRSPFVATVCQKLALRLLTEPDPSLADVPREYERRRHEVARRLATMGLRCSLPGGAFYFWIPIAGQGGQAAHATDGLEFSRRLLEQERVLLMPGNDFGPSGRGYVRLSYACAADELNEGLDRLERFVEERSAKKLSAISFRRWADRPTSVPRG